MCLDAGVKDPLYFITLGFDEEAAQPPNPHDSLTMSHDIYLT